MKLRPRKYLEYSVLELSISDTWWSSYFSNIAEKLNISERDLETILLNNNATPINYHSSFYHVYFFKKDEDILKCIEELEPYIILATLTED